MVAEICPFLWSSCCRGGRCAYEYFQREGLLTSTYQLRFVKKNDHDFWVLVKTLDIPQITARLTRELEKADARVDQTADLGDPGGNCAQDMQTGEWGHYHHSCIGQEDNYLLTCAFQSQREWKRNLNQLGLLGLPLLCFQNPEIAAGQKTLQGLAQWSCIYRTS
jgi:hypothetical protein